MGTERSNESNTHVETTGIMQDQTSEITVTGNGHCLKSTGKTSNFALKPHPPPSWFIVWCGEGESFDCLLMV